MNANKANKLRTRFAAMDAERDERALAIADMTACEQTSVVEALESIGETRIDLADYRTVLTSDTIANWIDAAQNWCDVLDPAGEAVGTNAHLWRNVSVTASDYQREWLLVVDLGDRRVVVFSL